MGGALCVRITVDGEKNKINAFLESINHIDFKRINIKDSKTTIETYQFRQIDYVDILSKKFKDLEFYETVYDLHPDRGHWFLQTTMAKNGDVFHCHRWEWEKSIVYSNSTEKILETAYNYMIKNKFEKPLGIENQDEKKVIAVAKEEDKTKIKEYPKQSVNVQIKQLLIHKIKFYAYYTIIGVLIAIIAAFYIKSYPLSFSVVNFMNNLKDSKQLILLIVFLEQILMVGFLIFRNNRYKEKIVSDDEVESNISIAKIIFTIITLGFFMPKKARIGMYVRPTDRYNLGKIIDIDGDMVQVHFHNKIKNTRFTGVFHKTQLRARNRFAKII